MDSAAASICTICLELVIENNGRSTARLQCNHVFHLDCIGSEFNVRRIMQCPNCRETEAGQWLFAGGEFGRSIQDEGVEVVEIQQPHLLSWMRNWVSDLPSPYGEMSMMLIHNASASYHHVPVPTFHQLHQNRWNAQVPHTLVGNGAVNRATQSLFASQPGRVLMRVHDAGLGVVPPLLTHEYQVLREVPSLPYESTATPTVHQMRVSSNQSQQPPLARVPVLYERTAISATHLWWPKLKMKQVSLMVSLCMSIFEVCASTSLVEIGNGQVPGGPVHLPKKCWHIGCASIFTGTMPIQNASANSYQLLLYSNIHQLHYDNR
ncbi:hypothetical protein LguiB_014669 [Lonicera macranthoides]